MQFVTSFLFLVLSYFFVKNVLLVNPLLGVSIAVTILVVGGVGFFPFLIMYDRYKNVFDYEPATLFGRETNGKNARKFLGRIMIFSAWLIFTGILFFALTKLIGG